MIGNLRADIIIDNEIVLEFKTIRTLNDAAELQGSNYLRLTGLKTAYLVNYPLIRSGRWRCDGFK